MDDLYAQAKLWEVRRQIAQTEQEIRALRKRLRQAKGLEIKPLKPLTREETTARRDAILKAWRNGETGKEIAKRLGMTVPRVWQLRCAAERDEFRALSADPFLPPPKEARIVRGQEYEFYPEDPDVPVVKVANNVQFSRDGWVKYRHQATSASTSKGSGAS